MGPIVTSNCFSFITLGIRLVLDQLELLFVKTPWVVMASFIILLTGLSAGKKAAIFCAAFLAYMGLLGFWEKAMTNRSEPTRSVLGGRIRFTATNTEMPSHERVGRLLGCVHGFNVNYKN